MTLPDLVSPIYDARKRAWKRYPTRTNRASSLGGDCERELVYARTAWEHQAMPDPGLLMIFAEGNKHEAAILSELHQLGIRITEQQTSLDWPDYQISGHTDFAVAVDDDGPAVPGDIKSMSSHIWDSIFKRGPGVYEFADVAAAFLAKPWLRKYPAQLYLYCLMRNVDRGILLCINKQTGALGQVNVPLDYDAAEELLQRAERINRHVAEGSLPERIAFDADICPRCPYYAHCLPDQQGRDPLEFVPDSAAEAWLEVIELTAEDATAHKSADAKFKEWAKAQTPTTMVVGPYLVTKKQTRAGVRVKWERFEEASE